MFETALLDDRRTRSRSWSMAAASIQVGLVGVVMLIPLISPDSLQMLVKQATISMQPLREAPPVQASTSSNHAQPQGPVISTTTREAKRFTAPGPRINPVAPIIDSSLDMGAPVLNTGPIGTGQFVPNGNATTIGSIDLRPPPEPKQVTKDVATGPVRIGGTVLEAKIIKRAIPIYPPLAKQARISGVVRLEGVIAKDGTIQKLRVLAGHPLLVTSALDAVRQWVYAPTQLNGQAVEVIAPIDVNFILNN